MPPEDELSSFDDYMEATAFTDENVLQKQDELDAALNLILQNIASSPEVFLQCVGALPRANRAYKIALDQAAQNAVRPLSEAYKTESEEIITRLASVLVVVSTHRKRMGFDQETV